MTYEEEENAVRQLGELIGYARLMQHARTLSDGPPKPVDLRIGRCIHDNRLNARCHECEQEQTNAGSVR